MRAEGDLPRIGAFTAACVLVSNSVGSGIFTTTGFMARDVGDPFWILALWLVGGALALAGALSYAELGAAMPRMGGEYLYLREAFGRIAAFLSGWTSFALGFGAAIAASSIGFAHYLAVLLPDVFARVPLWVPAVTLVWLITAIHASGVEKGGRFQRYITALKIGGLGGLVMLGFVWGDGSWSHFSSPEAAVEPQLGVAAVALIFVLYSFSGWNAAAYIAGEIRHPERNLPRALVAGTLFVVLLYALINLLYFYALPVSVLAAEPVLPVAEKAASALLGESASTAVSVLLCVSIAGAVSSMIWVGPRVTWAMARDGVVPPWLGARSEAGAPTRALVLQAVWVTAMLLTGSFEQLVIYGGFAIALFSAAAVASLFVLRWRQPERVLPFRVPGFPWVPASFIVATLWIALHVLLERPAEALWSLATVAAGLPVYAFWKRSAPPTV
jgi:APA family basic amino acid/polyamine antiporter